MTVLGAFQGDGCALIASDLKFTFLEEGNPPRVLVMPKFHRLPNGDYLGFNGRLNREEYAYLGSVGLEGLVSGVLMHNSVIRRVELLTVVYCSGTRLYAGTSEQQFLALFPGQPVFALENEADAGPILGATAALLPRAAYGRNFLKELSKVWEREFLRLESAVQYAAGYTSQLVTPEGARDLACQPGSLRGYPRARLELDGTVVF